MPQSKGGPKGVRKGMCRIVAVLFVLSLCLKSYAEDFAVYKDGKPAAVVVAADKGALRWARSFISHAARCTGKRLVLAEKEHPVLNTILLSVQDQKIPDDSFTIDFPGKRTMRIRGNYESLRNGTTFLLEKYFGVRFLTRFPSHLKKRPAGYPYELENHFPAKKNVSVPRKTVRIQPSVNLKRLFSSNIYHDWYVRQFTFRGGHGMTVYAFPARKYAPGDSWPEAILPVHRGKKIKLPKFNPKEKKPFSRYVRAWQPCWSNPETTRIAIENLDELLSQPVNPVTKAQHDSVELSVNDNGGCCECKDCLKVVNGKRNAIGRPDYSELYWTWIKNIALFLEKKYPGIYVVAYAYREVYNPPSFKLPSNVIPQLCRELIIGAIDPVQRKSIEKTFQQWSARADQLFIYDYLENTSTPLPGVRGGYTYVLPRVHIHSYADMFKMAYKNKVRGVYQEANHNIPFAGPTLYLMSKLYWDIHTDLDAHFKDWCEHAVGKKAAPYLMEYYLSWEKYWLRPEIRKTKWAGSARGTYMSLNEAGTYTYALTQKDLTHFSTLMQKVVDLAETPLQKKRAAFYQRLYRIAEMSADCLYSIYTEPDGTVKSLENARKLVKSISRAVRSLRSLKKETLVTDRHKGIVEAGICNLRAIAPYQNDPQIQQEFKRLLKEEKDLPPSLQGMLRVLTGEKFKNLFENGSFELPRRNTYTVLRRPGTLDKTRASHGKVSYKIHNGYVHFISKNIVPGKYYMVMIDLYAETASGEGRMNILTNPRVKGRNSEYIHFPEVKLLPGWQTFVNTFRANGFRNVPATEIFVAVAANFFEKNEPVWIDNVRLYQLN